MLLLLYLGQRDGIDICSPGRADQKQLLVEFDVLGGEALPRALLLDDSPTSLPHQTPLFGVEPQGNQGAGQSFRRFVVV